MLCSCVYGHSAKSISGLYLCCIVLNPGLVRSTTILRRLQDRGELGKGDRAPAYLELAAKSSKVQAKGQALFYSGPTAS